MISNETSALDEALVSVGYHVIDHFLPQPHYHALQTYVQDLVHAASFRPAKVGQLSQTTHNPLIRTDHIYWLDEVNAAEPVRLFFDEIHALKHFLNQQLYTGLSQFEAHVAVYQPNQYYKKHIDQFAGNQDRRISCVYYLNNAWQPEYGGELSIYNNNQQPIAHIIPEGNRLVCFNSALLHEVHLTHQPRLSIVGWLKARSLSSQY